MEKGNRMTGVTYARKDFPRMDYEVTLEGMKLAGNDFFCTTTFPVGDSFCSLVVGGWGGSTVGLSSINGQDASENETTQYEKLDHNKWYNVRVRVADGKIVCWLNDKQMVDVELAGNRISTRIEVDPNRPLGICSYNTEAGLKDIYEGKTTIEEVVRETVMEEETV